MDVAEENQKWAWEVMPTMLQITNPTMIVAWTSSIEGDPIRRENSSSSMVRLIQAEVCSLASSADVNKGLSVLRSVQKKVVLVITARRRATSPRFIGAFLSKFA